MKRVLSVLSLLVLLLPIFAPAICVATELDWITLGTDINEGGTKNDWRDVQSSSYTFSKDGEILGLRLECYGPVGNDWPKSGGRYKWFIDTSNPSDMFLSGGNIVNADYLLFADDSDKDGIAEMYFVVDTTLDGSFNDEVLIAFSDESYIIDGNSISMFIDLDLIGSPRTFAVTWATDQEDPNLNSAPNNDRVDGKDGIAGLIVVPVIQLTVNTVVLDEIPSSNWKYTILGSNGFSESFVSPAEGSSPTWVSGEEFEPGNYTVELTTKFGYFLTVYLEGDLDGGSVISDSKAIVDLDQGEIIYLTFKNTFLPAFTVSLDSPAPVDLDYNLAPLELTLVQSAWSTDINGDNRIDLVLDKPTAVLLNFTGVTVPSSVSVSITLGGISPDPIIKSAAELASNSIFSFYPIIPDVPGDITLTGYYSIGSGNVFFDPVDVTVKATTSPSIAYSYLYKVDRKGNLAEYEDVTLENYLQTVGNSTELLNITYPVSNLVTDENYVGIQGADPGSRRDPFKGLLTDVLAVAQDAQLRMGGTAVGIGIGPNNPGIDDYFTYHGFSGAAGISFGPSVKGVLILDGYYGGSAHEVAHTFGLYYGEPEEYQVNPLYGIITSGVRVETGEWMTGYDFMGAVAYGTLADTWVDSTTFAQLFTEFVDTPGDPQILLASAIINSDGTIEFPNTWYSLDEGYPDSDLSGDYALIFVDELGNELYQTSFDASFEVQIGGYPGVLPGTDGNLINQTAFDTMKTNSTGFSFVMQYPEGTAEVQIWNNTSGEQQLLGTMDADDIVHLQKYDVESWTTSSCFDDITTLEANFRSDRKTKTSTIVSTNPGTMYLNLLVENTEDHLIAPKIKITLPDTVDSSDELVSPAFNLKGATPIHVYSDLAMTNDVTQYTEITVDGKTINLKLNIPEGSLAYVTVHLEYVLIGTDGWDFDASQVYADNLPFNVYAPRILEDGTISTNILIPFEVIGNESI